MSLDAQDFSGVVGAQQAGQVNSFYPISLTATALNIEKEINIAPCDNLWLPSTYDVSYGLNPCQKGGGYDPLPIVAPGFGAVFGVNIPDIVDVGLNGSGQFNFLTSAAIWGLKFNSPNNPYLLWSIGTLLQQTSWGPIIDSEQPGFMLCGQSSMMRSISGPISRMWAKLYARATGPGQPNQDFTYSNTILLSSLGFNQQSVENVQPFQDATMQLKAPLTPASRPLASGGYTTTQLNSANKLYLSKEK